MSHVRRSRWLVITVLSCRCNRIALQLEVNLFMMNTDRQRIIIRVSAFLLSLLVAGSIQLMRIRNANAFVYWWNFWPYPSMYTGNTTGTVYEWNVIYGKNEWDSTDIGIASPTSSDNANIITYAGNYNNAYWSGVTIPYTWYLNSWYQCANWNNGALDNWCLGRSMGFAYIYFDVPDAPNPYPHSDNPKRGYVARHEMGHVWGMGHPACTDPISVMRPGNCLTGPQLYPDDVNFANTYY